MSASWRIGPLKLEALSGSESRLGTNPQAALRADIRRLGELLEQSLARQEGPELLAGLDLETAIKVVRARAAIPPKKKGFGWVSSPAPPCDGTAARVRARGGDPLNLEGSVPSTT